MKEYKKGTKFKVSGHDELLDKGWIFGQPDDKYDHKDFPGDCIIQSMIQYFGKTLTVTHVSLHADWYSVEENTWKWPVATFLETWSFKKDDENDHTCVEGVTPIDGWFICKHCGTNLKEIK